MVTALDGRNVKQNTRVIERNPAPKCGIEAVEMRKRLDRIFHDLSALRANGWFVPNRIRDEFATDASNIVLVHQFEHARHASMFCDGSLACCSPHSLAQKCRPDNRLRVVSAANPQ